MEIEAVIIPLSIEQQTPANIFSKTAFWNETTHWKLNVFQLSSTRSNEMLHNCFPVEEKDFLLFRLQFIGFDIVNFLRYSSPSH